MSMKCYQFFLSRLSGYLLKGHRSSIYSNSAYRYMPINKPSYWIMVIIIIIIIISSSSITAFISSIIFSSSSLSSSSTSSSYSSSSSSSLLFSSLSLFRRHPNHNFTFSQRRFASGDLCSSTPELDP